MEIEYPCQFKRLKRLEGMDMEEIEQQIIEESNSREINTNEINVEMMEDRSNTMHTYLPDYDNDIERNKVAEEVVVHPIHSQLGHFSMMQHPESIPSLQNYSNHDPTTNNRNSANPAVACKMVGSCWYCRRQDVIVSCRSCERMTCEKNCLYCCDKCQVSVCNTCSMIDYSYRYERRLCFDCYYQHYH